MRADGQMIPLGDIVGIWALTFETADCEGSIIMDFNANHGVKITQTINIENAKNVAFRYCSGSWQIINNGNLKLKLDISDGRNFLQWTVENSMALGNDTNIDQVKAEALLLDISKKLPYLLNVGITELMNVKDITLKRLILCVDGHAPIIFRRLKGYPKSELIPCETFYKENKQNVSIPEKFSTNNMQNDAPKDNRQKYISKGRLQNQVDNNDTRYECYLIENAILGYYYTQLCSEQGSLASPERQKEFKRRKFAEQDFERLQNPFSYYFIFNKNWYNQKTGASSIEDDGILWGDMSGAEYFTLYFDDIKFDYPHQATVKAHIDYGVRVVNKVYAMHHWNDIWWIDDIALPQEPIRMLSDWVILVMR